MIKIIKQHLQIVDPIHEHRVLVYQFIIVTLFSLYLYIYRQPPEPIFLLLAPLLNTVPAFFYKNLKAKVQAKLISWLIFSVAILLLSTFKYFGILIAPIIFIFTFGVLIFACRNFLYRTMACLSILITLPSLFMTFGWYLSVNIMIEVAVVLLFSVLVDMVFLAKKDNQQQLAFKAAAHIFFERLTLCIKAVETNSEVDANLQQQLLLRDMQVRNFIVEKGGYDNTLAKYYITARQSLYSIISMINACHKKNIQLDQALILERLQYLYSQTEVLFKSDAQLILQKTDFVNQVSEPLATSLLWAIENYARDLEILLTYQNSNVNTMQTGTRDIPSKNQRGSIYSRRSTS